MNRVLRIWRLGVVLAIVGLFAPMLSGVVAQGTGGELENEYFGQVWSRTDRPVRDGDVSRSWIWGQSSRAGWFYERYEEATNGKRLVQYFDKSRMEITQPDGDPGSIWYVTNGLLVVELISGRMQVGDSAYIERSPAEVNVAGDAIDPDGPTYATFAGLLDAPPLPFDQPIIQRVDREGNVTDDDSLAAWNVQVAQVDSVTGHAIAEPFWDFMTSSGTVYENGELTDDLLFADPLFGTGRPVTEAYWANVQVGGTAQDVLMQCFERRCLTYTPENDPEWRVEAGNVGQHYMTWRYVDTAPAALDGRVAYAVDDETGSSLWTANPDRSDAVRIIEPGEPITEVHWLPDGSGIAFVRQVSESSQALYVVASDGGEARQLLATRDDETFVSISVAPGSDWIMVSRRVPNPDAPINAPFLEYLGDIALVSVEGGQIVEPLDPEVGRTFDARWSPDGNLLAVNHSRWWGRPAGGPGATDNFSGDIIVMNVDGTNLVTITDDGGAIDNRDVVWSSDSSMIAYNSEYFPSSGINDNKDIFIVQPDGTGRVNLTDGLGGRNDGQDWSPDGAAITFRHDEVVGEPIYGYAQDTLYNVDVATGDLTELATEDGLDGLAFPDWAPQGDVFLLGAESGRSVALFDDAVWRFIGDADGRGRGWSVDGQHIFVIIGDSQFGIEPIVQHTWVFDRDGIPVAVYEGNFIQGSRLDYLD